jgi:hypothetical protein
MRAEICGETKGAPTDLRAPHLVGTQPLPGMNSRLPEWLLQPLVKDTATPASRTIIKILFMRAR